MIQFLLFLCFIAIFAIWLLMYSNKKLERESALAIVEFGEKIDEDTVNGILEQYSIDWYIFNETAIQEEEIEDLKQYYKVILEVK